jgi:hypothetical protein
MIFAAVPCLLIGRDFNGNISTVKREFERAHWGFEYGE